MLLHSVRIALSSHTKLTITLVTLTVDTTEKVYPMCNYGGNTRISCNLHCSTNIIFNCKT